MKVFTWLAISLVVDASLWASEFGAMKRAKESISSYDDPP